jgi:hypothetical protein
MGHEGVDISEHQGDLAPEWFDQWAYVIIRAFNENGFADIKFAQNWARAEGRTKRGVYGWPIPGRDNFVFGRTLVQAAPGAEAGYWADVENSGRGLATAAETEAYLRGIEDAGGFAGFYSNIGQCPRNPYLEAHDWWMADYGPNDGSRHDPNEQPPRPQRPYTIHQYTSIPLDTNYADSLDWTGDDVVLSDDDINRITLPLIRWMQNHVTGHGDDGKTEITNRMVLDPVLTLVNEPAAQGGGGLSKDEVRAVVREELDSTGLAKK